MFLKKFLLEYSTIITIAWALVIFILCATPGQYIPSTNWLELLSFDKFVHASLFFVLSCLFFVVGIKYKQPKTLFVFYFLLCVLYGGLLEIMQAKCFSNRSADWKDFVANSFGCILAVLFLKKLKHYLIS